MTGRGGSLGLGLGLGVASPVTSLNRGSVGDLLLATERETEEGLERKVEEDDTLARLVEQAA